MFCFETAYKNVDRIGKFKFRIFYENIKRYCSQIHKQQFQLVLNHT